MFKKVLLFSLCSLISLNSWAAGYQLQEYSVTGLGRAFAGAGVMGDDFSALAYNPAGMSVNETSGEQLGVTGIDVRTTVYGSAQDSYGIPDKSSHTFSRLFRLMPNLFGQKKLNEKATLGVGIYAPYGLAIDYPNWWYGRTHGLYSGITLANLTPAISYKILDTLALGLGVNLQYAEAHLTGALPVQGATDIHGKDFGVGGTFGLTWTPVKETRLGLSYRSSVTHKLTGDNKVSGSLVPYLQNGQYDVTARITTPETVMFSAAQEVGKKWTLSSLIRWTRWDRFNRLTLNQKNLSIPLSSTYENWRNTWFVALGADYRLNKNWTFRVGSAYDQPAVRSMEYRTPRIPDARRIWVSGGLSYQNNNWQLDLGYAHLFIKRAEARGQADDPMGQSYFYGNYDSKSDIAGIQLQYKF